MEQLATSIALPSLAVVLPLLLLALFVGFVSGRAGRGRLTSEIEALRAKARRGTPQMDDQRRAMAKMQRELDTVANLAMTMPHVVRDLNRDDLDPGDVPALILRLATAIFEPEQVLLYGIRTNGQQRVLTLSDRKGLERVPHELTTVNVGQGKLGWVAEHELDMLPEDWATLKRTEQLDVPSNHPSIKTDIVGPLVHHAKNRQHVLGVLSIGAPRIRPRDPKLMFQMVTNFGSMALVNAWNMKRLRSAAHHDGLTGLLNKRCFLEDVAANSLVKCEKTAQPFSIFIFDIDHFKTYNDTNGHPAGDELLRGLGRMIKQSTRPGDVACRYGGEEFVIGMPNTDREAAYEVAEAIRKRIESEPFAHREKQPSGKVSISGGVASFPKDGSSVGELVQRADEALYQSKKGGRNRVTRYKGVDIGDTSDEFMPLTGGDESALEELSSR